MYKRFVGMTSVGVLSVFLAAGCNEAPREAPPQKMSSDDLDRTVTGKINSDAALAVYNIDVDADADKNAVTLSGSVPTQALRTKAVELAKSGNEALVVTDKIDVKPGDVDRKDYSEDMAREARERARESGDSSATTWMTPGFTPRSAASSWVKVSFRGAASTSTSRTTWSRCGATSRRARTKPRSNRSPKPRMA
jgi:hypothetical protein